MPYTDEIESLNKPWVWYSNLETSAIKGDIRWGNSDMLTLENGIDALSRNVGNKPTNPEERRSQQENHVIEWTVGIQGDIHLLGNVGNNARLCAMFGQSFPDSEKVLNSLWKKKYNEWSSKCRHLILLWKD
jgi:hypothetical protein